MAIFGFSAFDTSVQASGTTTPQTAGPLTPANALEWAIIANDNGGTSGPTPAGWTNIFDDASQISILNLPTTSPISISTIIGNTPWSTNLLLFGGPSYPLTAAVTSVTILSNGLTLVTASQTFIVGTQVRLSNLVGANFLNGQVVKILSNTGTSITAAFTHPDYGPASDSGTASNLPYLQLAHLSNPASTPISLAFPNPVTAGSTILVGVLSNDTNAFYALTSATDNNVNAYTVQHAGGFGFGYTNLAWATLVAAGATTVTVDSTSHNSLISTRMVILELPQGLFKFSLSGNAGIAGAILTLSGDASATTTADGSGNYSFANLVNGNYVVTPSLGAFVFAPPSRNVTINNADVTGVNFTVGDQVSIAEVQIEVTYQNPGNFLYARDVNSWGDGGTFGGNNGTPYSQCFVTIGSIELAQLGAPGFPLTHVFGYFDAVGKLNNGGPSDPNVFILPNEISDTAGIGFVELPEVENEPPIGQNHASKTILARRWNVNMMNSYLASQFIHSLQLKISWEPENAPSTIKAIAFGENPNV